MASKKRQLPPQQQRHAIQQFGNKIAEANNLPITSIRYAEYTLHGRDGWTFEAGWERRIDGAWQPFDNLGIALHSSPSVVTSDHPQPIQGKAGKRRK